MVTHITTRPVTVAATLGGTGQGSVRAYSGATAALAGLASEPGFTPLELMDAALSGCLVLSVRIAARKHGWGDRLQKVDVVVTKAQPPQAILDANAQKSVEEAQKGSEKTEIDGVIENIRKLRADDIGFSAEKAYEILGAERNKTPTQRQIFKLEGVEPIVDKLVPLAEKLIERIFNQDSNKTGGS